MDFTFEPASLVHDFDADVSKNQLTKVDSVLWFFVGERPELGGADFDAFRHRHELAKKRTNELPLPITGSGILVTRDEFCGQADIPGPLMRREDTRYGREGYRVEIGGIEYAFLPITPEEFKEYGKVFPGTVVYKIY